MANLSVRAMADALGLKKSAVGEYKAAGMPMTDAEAAKRWVKASVPGARKAVTRPGTQAPAHTREGNAKNSKLTGEVAALPDAELDAGDFVPVAMPPIESSDFDAAMLKADAQIVIEARALVNKNLKSGDAAAFNFALGNYSKLVKEFVAARMRWLESEEKAKRLVDEETVMTALEVEVSEWRRGFEKLGDRIAASMTGEPVHDKAVIDEAVNKIFRGFGVATAKATKLFQEGGES